MSIDLVKNSDLKQWIVDLKSRIRQSQIRAMVKVNSEMLRLYWDLGRDIAIRQMDAAWGSGFFKQLSKELKDEFPDLQGFSATNLRYCKYFYQLYAQDEQIRQQAVDEIYPQAGDEMQVTDNKIITIHHQVGDELEKGILHQAGANLQSTKNKDVIIYPQAVDKFDINSLFLIPWGHQRCIIDSCKSVPEALFYVQKTIKNGWSRAMLMNFIEANLYQSQGKAVNNFDRLLPEVQSDLAREMLKDPYNFDFLALTENYKEKELEDALVSNITKFLLELGQGFAYVGRQYPIQIGSKLRNIDLLFYHLELRCYVVIELKVKEFEPEHTGKLGYYMAAVNNQLKKSVDNPTVGLLIVKKKDNIDAQYSLESSSQPIGISEYMLSKLLPDSFKSSLPSIEEIERELNKEN